MREKQSRITVELFTNIIIVLAISLVLIGSLAGTGIILTNATPTKALYQGNTAEKRVTLMVNVYWGTEYIEPMLEIFDRNNITTTFFVGGSWVAKNDATFLKIVESGHEIGNHGYLHKNPSTLNEKQNRDEIILTEKLVEKLTGKKTTLFAPPSGDLSSTMFTVTEDLNYKVIMFNKDTIDWRDQNADLILKRATQNAQNGDFILMHPTECTVKALPEIIKVLKEKGFEIVTVSENLAPSAE